VTAIWTEFIDDLLTVVAGQRFNLLTRLMTTQRNYSKITKTLISCLYRLTSGIPSTRPAGR